MNVLSLFAGIGGLDLGLEWAGFRTVGFVEKDSACRHWLSQHWPGVLIHDDIHTFSGVPFRGRVDLVCGGFPCQPFSVAGKQKGTEDERHLWPEMSRVIREVRPAWVLAENVPGIRTIAADLVLEDLEGQGYTCWPLVVGADDVGAPHRRKRVWVVAYRDGGRCEADRGGEILNGVREARRYHAYGRGKGTVDGWSLVGSPTSEGLEGQRADSRQPQEPELRHTVRWPSRPGELQHAWEAPRLAHTASQRRNGRTGRDGMADTSCEPSRSPGQPRQSTDTRLSESPMGSFADGLPGRLAGLTSAHRREALKALGNAVCPVNVYHIGRAILSLRA